MGVTYKQRRQQLVIEMNPGRVMPAWLIVTMALITLSVLAALWAGFIDLRPWELTHWHARYLTRGTFLNLVALSGLLVMTVRGEFGRARERVTLDGASMIHTRYGRIGIPMNTRYDLRKVTGLTVEPGGIAFEYAEKRYTLGHLLDTAEQREVVQRIGRHRRGIQ